MKKLLDKAKSSFKDSQSPSPSQSHPPSQSLLPETDQPSKIAPPTPLDVLRYRYHHGTNLGSIFLLERWLTPSMFPPPSTRGDSELAAATACLRAWGPARTKAHWEEHWASAVSESDFEWLVHAARCTSLRLPIGYWTLGQRFCEGTPFEGALAPVYEGAWGAVRELVRRARAWGVGVLVDFHGLPGGANADAHSGSGSGKAEFWGSGQYRELAKRCLGFLAGEVREMDGVIGLQVVNEAVWGAPGMYEWYEEVLGVVGEVDASLPIYISDGWDLGRALRWTNARRGVRNPVVVDTHKYYTFSDKDRSQTPAEIISRIPHELPELDGKEGSISDRGEAQVIIGEYSCVLDGQTWGRVRPEEKEGYVTQFGRVQTSKWRERAGGAYFWTFKMDWMDGGEWGFVEQVKKGNVLPPPSLLLPKEEVQRRAGGAQQQRGDLAKQARESHEEYWSRTCTGQHFEHDRYSQGWDVGFSDALFFFVMRADGGLGEKAGAGGDRIGVLDIWVKKRLLESGQGGTFVWEWEQGFRAGVKSFNATAGI
jgi:aryl-phospho-beta-D-glucosidase BglC (GH1 family)